METQEIAITQKLLDFFEEEGFNVYLFEEEGKTCAEIEKWTNGGVDMIIQLIPFTVAEFIEYINDFDVDKEIDLHRQGVGYKEQFTIRESLKDFTNFHKSLKKTAAKLKKIR